jgi:crotonobetainyl-CoA:carnitine CoA-transferase CaiB-like acyl-CoA transferase
LPALASDPKFATNPARIANRVELVEALKVSTRTYSSRALQALLREIKVPGGPIQTIDEVFTDPQVLARNMVVDVPHPKFGPVKTVANPIKYSATPLEYAKAPPSLGEDTEFVLRDVLGKSEEQIEQLRERGVFGT